MTTQGEGRWRIIRATTGEAIGVDVWREHGRWTSSLADEHRGMRQAQRDPQTPNLTARDAAVLQVDRWDAAEVIPPGGQTRAELAESACPARRVLREFLARYGDEPIFRTGDGALTAREMLAALDRNDAVAEAFLRDLHATALEILAMRAEGKL